MNPARVEAEDRIAPLAAALLDGGPRMRRLSTLVAIATLVMSACTGASTLSTGTALVAPEISSPSIASVAPPAGESLARAIALVREQPGYRYTFELALGGLPEVPAAGGLSVTGAGSVDPVANRTSMLLDLRSVRDLLVAGGGVSAAEIDEFLVDGRVELLQDGSTLYVRMPALAQRLGSSKPWLSLTVPPEGDPTGTPAVPGPFGALGGGGIPSPADYLAQLQQLDASVRETGTEVLRGVSTTRYSGVLDLRTLMAARMTPAQAADLNSMMPYLDAFKLPFDVWIGADGLPRRFVLTMKLESLIGAIAPQTPSGAVQPAPALTFAYDLFDYGAADPVTAPPADQVTVVDPRQLESLR